MGKKKNVLSTACIKMLVRKLGISISNAEFSCATEANNVKEKYNKLIDYVYKEID